MKGDHGLCLATLSRRLGKASFCAALVGLGTLATDAANESARAGEGPFSSGVTRCLHLTSDRATSAETNFASEPARAWSLDVLESLALNNNPTLIQAAAAIDEVRGNLRQAGLYPNPQVGYLRTDSSPSGQSRSDGVFFGQEFVTAGKLRKSQAIEQQELARFQWEYEAQRWRVANDVRIRYYETLGAQRSVDIARDLLGIAEEGYQTVSRLRDAGQASQADVLQARIQRNLVKQSLRELESQYDAAWSQLTNLTGCINMERAPLAGVLDGDIPNFEFESDYQRLLSTSPQLRAAEVRAQEARQQLVREKAEPVPNVSLQIVAERDQIQDFNSVSTFLAVPVPFFNRNQGNIETAAAGIREAQSEVQRTRLALRDQLAEAWQRYTAARAQVESLRDEILPDARESLAVAVSGYKAGEIGFVQVLSIRQTYFEANLAYVRAWTDLRKVAVEINGLLLTGGLNPAELGTALQSQPGGRGRSQALINQLQEAGARQILPPAIQAGAAGP